MRHTMQTKILSFCVGLCILSFTKAGYNVNGRVMGDNDIFEEEFNGNLKFQQCGGIKPAIQLNSMSANPKQFFIPENVSLSIEFTILEDLLPPIQVEIKISKKLPLFGYIKLPCIANYGSCTFENGCDILDTRSPDSFAYHAVCPNWLRATGITCKCPFKKGHYSAINTPVPIENSIVPKWIATGDYKVVLIISDRQRTAGCLKFQFRLI